MMTSYPGRLITTLFFSSFITLTSSQGFAQKGTTHEQGSCICHPNFHDLKPNSEKVRNLNNNTMQTRGNAAQNEVATYYYDLFTSVTYEAPLRIQQRLLDAAQQNHDFFMNFVGAPNYTDLMNLNNSVLNELRAEMHTVSVNWQNGNVVRFGNTSTIPVARGLHRGVLVDILNSTSNTITLSVGFSGNTSFGNPQVTIAPGQTRTVMTSIYTGSTGNQNTTLNLSQINGGASRSLAVNISSSAPATIVGTIMDQDDNTVSPGRIWANGPDNQLRVGTEFANNSTLTNKPTINFPGRQRLYSMPFFYSDGTFEVMVPAGSVELTLERGPEHPLVNQTVNVSPGQTLQVNLQSSRVYNMKQLGWYSGDTHIHWAKNWWSENEDLTLLDMVMRAEDLRVANNLLLYQHQDSPQSPFIKPDQAPMGPVPGYSGSKDYHIQMAEEYRNDFMYGHINLLGITERVEPVATGQGSGGPAGTLDYPTNKTAIDQARAMGGINVEAHGLGHPNASYVVANVAHDIADTIDQLPPEDYYDFLNAGFKIGLSNGSDHPARLAGEARVYTKVDGPFTYEKWLDGMRNGRTFTTSGPLLFLNVNGAEIGEEICASQNSNLTVTATAYSRYPIGNFQIVSNGTIIHDVDVAGNSYQTTINVPANEAKWFVARCSQTNNFNVLKRANTAHTSAVYVSVNGKRAYRQSSVQRWINLLNQQASYMWDNGVYANNNQRLEATDHMLSAVSIYQDIINAGGMAADCSGNLIEAGGPSLQITSPLSSGTQNISGIGSYPYSQVELIRNGNVEATTQADQAGGFNFWNITLSSGDEVHLQQQETFDFGNGSSGSDGWFNTNTGAANLSFNNGIANLTINSPNGYAALANTSLGHSNGNFPSAGTGHPSASLRVLEVRLRNPGTTNRIYIGTNDGVTGPPQSYVPMDISPNSNQYITYQFPLTNNPGGKLPVGSRNFWLLLLPQGATSGDTISFDYIRVREYLDYHFENNGDLMGWWALNGFSSGLNVINGSLNATTSGGSNRLAMYMPPTDIDTQYFNTFEVGVQNSAPGAFQDILEWADRAGTGFGASPPNYNTVSYSANGNYQVLTHDLIDGANGLTWGAHPTSKTFIYSPADGASSGSSVSIDYLRMRSKHYYGPSAVTTVNGSRSEVPETSLEDWWIY